MAGQRGYHIMPRQHRFLLISAAAIALAAGAAPAASLDAQPPAFSPLELLASPPAAIIRQRAMHTYRMPDGVIWDGASHQDYRRVLSRNLRQFERVERARPAPGAPIVEDRPAGTIWRFRDNADTRAWGIFEALAHDDGAIRWPYGDRDRRDDLPLLATADPRRWKDAPPLWSSAEATDFSWNFALIDEQDPDPWTKAVPGSYLRITRDWGDGRFEIEGHSIDLGRIAGIVEVPDHRRNVRRDRLRGTFFLWPQGTISDPGGYARESWRYIPADELRITPEELAEALIDGAAHIIDWRHQRIGGRLIWQRTKRPVQLAEPRSPARERPRHIPPPEVGKDGPDLIMLTDGRWFRGRLIERTEAAIRFSTRIGEMESVLVFSAAEVADLQSPERVDP
jgi:hypothetical protein